jgi:hypothetical protein
MDFGGNHALHDERIGSGTRLMVFAAFRVRKDRAPPAGVSEPTQRNTPSATPLATHSLCAAVNSGAAARFSANFNKVMNIGAPWSNVM